MKSRRKLKKELELTREDLAYYKKAYTELDEKMDRIQEVIGWRFKARTQPVSKMIETPLVEMWSVPSSSTSGTIKVANE